MTGALAGQVKHLNKMNCCWVFEGGRWQGIDADYHFGLALPPHLLFLFLFCLLLLFLLLFQCGIKHVNSK